MVGKPFINSFIQIKMIHLLYQDGFTSHQVNQLKHLEQLLLYQLTNFLIIFIYNVYLFLLCMIAIWIPLSKLIHLIKR